MSVRNALLERLPFGRHDEGDRLAGYDWEGVALLLPVILTFVLVSVIPIAYGFWLSFQSGTGAVDLQWVGLSNYAEVVGVEQFHMSIWRGLVFAVYSVFLQLVLGISIALALNHWTRWANLTRAIIFLPYMIPTVAVATMFKWMLNNEVGVVNYLLQTVGLIGENITFFSSESFLGLSYAMHSVVWASTWKWTVFVVLVVLARLQSIDQTLYEAAKTNGAGTIRQFFDVTYPNIKSILFLLVLLRSIWQFSKFEMIYLLTQGGPFNLTTTMVVYAYEQAFGQLAFGTSAAVTTMIFLILFAFAIVYFRVFSPEEEVEVAE